MKSTITALALSSFLLTSSHAESASSGLIGIPDIDFASGSRDASTIGLAIGTLNYTQQFSSDFDSLPGDVSVDNFSLWTPLVPLNFGEVHVISYLGYSWTQFDTSTPNLLTEDSLQTFYLPVAAVWEPKDRWLAGIGVMPGYSGASSSSDNFSFAAAAAVGYEYSDDLLLYGGFYYSEGFGESTFIPGIAFDWKFCDRWSFYILGPIGGIRYEVSDNWLISLVGDYEIPTWHIKGSDGAPDRDITVSSFNLGLKSEHRVGKYGWAYLSAGYSFLREMEIEDLSDNVLQKDDIDSGAFVELGMTLRF